MAGLRRRDVIIGIGVSFIAWLWTVHFIPALRFVPHAFICGALVTIGGFAYLLITTTNDHLSILHEVPPQSSYLGFTTPKRWKRESRQLRRRNAYNPLRIHEASKRISRRLDDLLDFILRDFVKSWYIKISSGSTFSNEIDRAIRGSLKAVLKDVFRLDLVEFGVTRLLPVINRHLQAYGEAERLVRGKRLNLEDTTTKELEIMVAQRYKEGKLHPASSLTASKIGLQQQHHLRRLVSRLLPMVMPKNMQSSTSVITLVKEIVACAVLMPVVTVITDPDMLNQLIENYGRSILHERKTVKKLRAALDEHATPGSKRARAMTLHRLKPEDSERSFEAFVKTIRTCTSLQDANRYRADLARQIKRESASGSRDVTFLRRLEIGRKLLDQKAEELAAQVDPGPDLSQVTLRELLYDASGLAYFMEFMDGQNLLGLVQFWIVADGFRNNATGSKPGTHGKASAWVQSDRDLLVQISGRYLWKSELQVTRATQDSVNTFLNAGDAGTYQQYTKARLSILELQDTVYSNMEKQHLAHFKSSDLFKRWSGAPIISAPKASSHVDEFADRSAANGHTRPARPGLKAPELRRAVASHSDLANALKKNVKVAEPRRSLDEGSDRRPLFDDQGQAYDDPLARSSASLDSLNEGTPEAANGNDEKEMLDAVQAALDAAMDDAGESDNDMTAFGQDGPDFPLDSPQVELDGSQEDFLAPLPARPVPIGANGKPSLSSLGLVGTPSRRTVFSDGDLFGEREETLLEDDEGHETDFTNKTDEEDIHEAAPGDLGLSELVQSLTLDIDKLEAQQKVVDSMMQKAELTNNPAELRILRKSKASLEREIRRKELQRQQYIVQRSENDLYGKAKIMIKSIMVGKEPDGHEFALYVIEVTRQATEKSPAVTWAITRRYSEFHDLHRRLRKRHPSLKDVDFPRRQVVLTLQKDFLKKRSAALEKYLRELLSRPQICRSLEFRAFLSQQTIRPVAGNGQQVDKTDFITRIYSSVSDGMEEFIGNVPVLDQLSAAGQSLVTAAMTYTAQSAADSLHLPKATVIADPDNPRQAAEAQAEISAFEDRADPETVTFIKPICDILLETFQLNQGNNWLRGRAVVVVTQQLLGGTIERKVRETYKQYTSESSICKYLDMALELMWPNGVFRKSAPERTEKEKESSMKNAAVVLQTLLPDLAGGVVGRSNATNAGRRLHATLNNEILNRHLAYVLLDEVVDGVFGVRGGTA